MSFKFFGRVIFISLPVLVIMGLVFTCFAAWGGYKLLKKPDTDILFVTDKNTQGPDAKKTPANKRVQEKNHAGATGQTPVTNEQQNQDIIHVYIVGCVNNPGMYAMKKGQMIYDAVEKAGGLTKDADRENINMAYILNENVMLKILPVSKKNDSTGGSSNLNPIENSGASTGTGTGVQVISGGNENGLGASSGKNAEGKVNINTATLEELKTLPGIGDAKARDIINYRNENGPFKAIEDIMKVPGIKEARFNSLKDKICV